MADTPASNRTKGWNLRSRITRVHIAAAIGALLAMAFGLFFHEFRFGSGLVNFSYDQMHVWRGDVRVEEATIVYLDDISHQKLGQPQNAPWDRALHARLIERLTAAGARAVVFDIVFSDPNPNAPAADEQLAAAIKKSGRVVLGADNVPVSEHESMIVPPFSLLLDNAAAIGSVERAPEGDLVIRRHTPRGDSPISILSWATAELLKSPVTQIPGAETRPRWMNYYGRPLFIPWKSYYEALDPALSPEGWFRDKVVFVGARVFTRFAGDRKDEFPNPFSIYGNRRSFMPGVEIQATEFLNLLRGDWLRRVSFGLERWLIAMLGLFIGAGLVFLRPVPAAVAAVAASLFLVTACYFLFAKGLIWFPWMLFLVQIAAALFWSVLFNSVQLYVQKRLYEQALRVHLPPKLVKKYVKSPTLLNPGAEKQLLTLFFSDIENFTTISEKMDSDELAAMMNEYFESAVSQCIYKTDGTVVKYIGDSIFAFWNAPEPQIDHAIHACEAALRFRALAERPVRGKLLRTRIGLHGGMANVGNFGSVERVDYTAIGESVNLASRLEGLNKYLGTSCLWDPLESTCRHASLSIL